MRDSTSQFISGILAIFFGVFSLLALLYLYSPSFFWSFIAFLFLVTLLSLHAKPRKR